jgi:hypothetical protein
VFAYIASLNGTRDWPVALMHRTEVGFVIVAVACLVLGMIVSKSGRARCACGGRRRVRELRFDHAV